MVQELQGHTAYQEVDGGETLGDDYPLGMEVEVQSQMVVVLNQKDQGNQILNP